MPAPPSTKAGKRSEKYCPSTGRRVSHATESADTSRPAVSVARTPSRPTTDLRDVRDHDDREREAEKARPVSTAE